MAAAISSSECVRITRVVGRLDARDKAAKGKGGCAHHGGAEQRAKNQDFNYRSHSPTKISSATPPGTSRLNWNAGR